MKNSYTINLFNLDGFEEFSKDLDKLVDALDSKDFMNFLADKCMEEVKRITSEKLRTENYTTDYRSNHKRRVTEKKITIKNNSMVDLSHLSPETLARYPNGLSLAKIIEFGTGIPRDRQFRF